LRNQATTTTFQTDTEVWNGNPYHPSMEASPRYIYRIYILVNWTRTFCKKSGYPQLLKQICRQMIESLTQPWQLTPHYSQALINLY
jgi:hypothetical protein